MQINITDIIKQSAKFNIVKIITGFIYIPRNVVIAAFLLPEEYGIVGFLSLWLTYANFLNPGIFSAGQREIPYFLGKNKENEMLRVQNISISASLLYSIIPFLVIFCASFFFDNPVIKIGLIITAISFVITRLVNYCVQTNFSKQKFTLVAKGNLINAVSVFIALIALIFYLKIYAILIAPIIGATITGFYYFKKSSLGYKFQFDWGEIKRLFKVGIVLSLGAFVFWGYAIADRTIIAASLSLRDLGLYVYAIGFVRFGGDIFADFGRVLQPILWEKSGREKKFIDAFSDTKRVAVYLAVSTALAIPFFQTCFYFLVNLIIINYKESMFVFYILSCNLYLASLIVIPNLILASKVVNKQAICTTIYLIGLVLNIVFDLIVIRLGYGIYGIAWVTVISQGLATFVAYFLIRKYVFGQSKEFVFFLFLIVFPFLISMMFTIFHNLLSLTVLNPWFFGLISLSMQVIIWSMVILIGYRKYFSKEKIINFIREFVGFATGKIKNFKKA